MRLETISFLIIVAGFMSCTKEPQSPASAKQTATAQTTQREGRQSPAKSTQATTKDATASQAARSEGTNTRKQVTPPPRASLVFGVVPQQAPSKIMSNWRGLAKKLSELSGLRFVVKTAPSIPEFERRLAAGRYDVAYMNPYHYTVFSQTPGYVAFAKQRDKRIRGIMVVRKDSPHQTPTDLKGAKAAFPSPAAFAASMLTRATLNKLNVPVQVSYVKSHDSVYRNVARGIHQVGGGVMRTFKAMPTAVTDQLRVLWESPGYTPHAFAFHPRLDAQTRAALQRAVTELSKESAAAPFFQPIRFKGLTSAKDADWDDVRALQLKTLQHFVAPAREGQ